MGRVGSYPTFSPLPMTGFQDRSWAVSLCCTCPEVTLGGRYPLSLPCGARTFLIRGLSACVRGCLTWSRKYCTPRKAKCQISLQILLKNSILYKIRATVCFGRRLPIHEKIHKPAACRYSCGACCDVYRQALSSLGEKDGLRGSIQSICLWVKAKLAKHR